MEIFQWTTASLSDVGNIRKINEDALVVNNQSRLWAVADGMGGHHAGDHASQSIVNTLKNNTFSSPETSISARINTIEDKILAVNEDLWHMGKEQDAHRTIGSTVMCLLNHQSHIAYIWAGDSRLYRFRQGNLKQLSKDHSETQRLVDIGHISHAEAKSHPTSNIITKAVGAYPQLYLEVNIDNVQPDDIYLLCTDGLYRDIGDEEIEEHLSNCKNDISMPCEQLMNLALSRSGADNISLVLTKPSLN